MCIFTLASPSLQGTQLFIQVCDRDTNLADDLIDIFQVDVAASSLRVGVESNPTTYTGLFNYTTINLSFSIQCVENFRGPTCSECIPGFTGTQCEVNIDDCMDFNCGVHGVCTDGVDSYTCSCDQGFTGDLCDQGNTIYVMQINIHGQKIHEVSNQASV